MADTFDANLSRIAARVGGGELVGRVTFDQVYAKVQHERLDFDHPLGGGAKYLENPLKEKYSRYVEALAADALNGSLVSTMTEAMEDLAGESARRAPIEEGTLRASASPTVTDDGVDVYRRPGAPRIEED